MAYRAEDVDEKIKVLERSAEFQIANAHSKVKGKAAERDLLSVTEDARDLLERAIKSDKQLLDGVFGGDCERIGRLRLILDRVKLSAMHEDDQRWHMLREQVDIIEALLKELGTYKPWAPPKLRAPTSIIYKGWRRRMSPGRKISMKCDVEPPGGEPSSFEVSPPLPDALALDTSTGAIVGVLQLGTVVEETAYVVTGRNEVGEARAELVFAVSEPPPTAVAYHTASPDVMAGRAITWAPQIEGGWPNIWSVTPALPGGLLLDAESGTIRGKALAAAVMTTYHIVAANPGGQATASISFLVRPLPATPPVYADVPEDGLTLALGRRVELSPEVTGPGLAFSCRTLLPKGLTINEETGLISGVPREVTKMATYEILVRNESGDASSSIGLEVRLFAPSNVSYPEVGELWTERPVQLDPATGEWAGCRWRVAPALPDGLLLDEETGSISGVPSQACERGAWTITASNAAGRASCDVSFAVRLSPPAKLSYPRLMSSLKNGALQVLRPVSVEVSIEGQVDVFSVEPALPVGLVLDDATGLISGTPTSVAGEETYVVTARNAAGECTKSLTLAVRTGPPSDLAYLAISVGNVFIAGQDIGVIDPTHSGGPTDFKVRPPLPRGMLLDPASGTISGKPEVGAEEAGYIITASNEAGEVTTTVTFSVDLDPPTSLQFPSFIPNCAVGEEVNFEPMLDGRFGTTFVVAPDLPRGLAIDEDTGCIRGVPEEVAEETIFTVTASNQAGSISVELAFEIVETLAADLVAETIDVNFAVQVDAITEIAELMPEPSKTKAYGDWMVWQVHRAYLDDPTLVDFNFNNMHMPPPHVEARIAPKLAKAMATNTHIEVLSLVNSNLIKSEGVVLAESLASNTTLKVLNLENNLLDSNAVREIAVQLAGNKGCVLETLRVSPQKQIGSFFGRPVEEAFGPLLDGNNTITKLGFQCNDANWRNIIDRSLLRNNDFARRRRRSSRAAFSEEEEPEAQGEERIISRLTLRIPPDGDPTKVFQQTGPSQRTFRQFVAQQKRVPQASQLQSFARNCGTPLKYSEVSPLLRECRKQLLDAAVGTEVTVADAFEAEVQGLLRSWSEKNDSWTFKVWIAENSKWYPYRLNKEPVIIVNDAWSAWLQASE